ncbi:MAG: Asp-tRNA(Asn)/Glu-tRNA(Gln) amidotransferase subunit GatB [bacterium]|nr:Asp-tRNA(Asn)/Glu-tRNA(Gln) amidotransferase subunit GatB [bacterium]
MQEIKCGLEIHGYLQMDSKRKLFCDCKIDTNGAPNTNICPICTGQPGNKPMPPNKDALKKIIAVAAMLDCKINKRLLFQRKHYTWPDLPNGYQKTMSGSYSVPVGEKGKFLGIGITDVHLEEDPAKWDPETGTVDYNRSGFPLVEIVTEPDFRSSDEVRGWLKKLMTMLSYIDAVDPDAGVKSDVNVSIAPKFDRVEVKNVNSFKSIVKTIEHEIARQQRSDKVNMETRAWNEATGQTVFMRSKEQAMDYMFIPDPDLPVVNVDETEIKAISSKLPEKPHEKAGRYVKEWKVDKTDAAVISSDLTLAEIFEKAAKEIDPVLASRWLRKDLMRVLNYNKKELHDVEMNEKHLIQLLKLVESKKITDTVAQKILEKLIEKPFDVNEYVKKEGLAAVSDKSSLEKFCKEAIAENEGAVEDYKAGNEKALNFIVGSVMRKTRGAATPKEVNDILKKLIK